METGEKPESWEQNARRYHQAATNSQEAADSPTIDLADLDPTNPDHVQWIADHPDLFDTTAKKGDTQAEQEGMEELP